MLLTFYMIYIAIIFYINTCVPCNDEMIWSWHRGRPTSRHLRGGKSHIDCRNYKALIQLMIKEIHKQEQELDVTEMQ